MFKNPNEIYINSNSGEQSPIRTFDLTIINRLLASESDINQYDRDGNTPLLTAISSRNLPIIDRLITAGADVNQPDLTGRNTPLISAARLNELLIVERLLTAGAAVNQPNIDGNTPIIEASWGGGLRLIEILIAAGANIEQTNRRGGNAESVARASKNRVILPLLTNPLAKSGKPSVTRRRLFAQKEIVPSPPLMPINPEDDCPICLERVLMDSEGNIVEFLADSLFYNCRHGMHQACYQDIIRVCPLCRAPKRKGVLG